MLLTVNNVVRQFDFAPVLQGVSFDVRAGERIGLVGPNGAGKTTLVNILAGRDEPDEGRVELANGVTLGLLQQQPNFAAGRTLLDEARSGLQHILDLQAEAQRLADELAAGPEPAALVRLQKRLDDVQHHLQHHGGYAIDHLVDRVLLGLGFTKEQYTQEVRTMSGGQQNRVLLARLLLQAPEILLLDEPTNHLDIEATEWLEQFLLETESTLIVVSHDRYFLDRVTNRVLELHRAKLTSYPGNFSQYWRLREERQAALDKTREKQLEEVARTEEYIRKNSYGQNATRAKDRVQKLSRMEVVEAIPMIEGPQIGFTKPTRTGDWVIDADHLDAGYERPLVRDFSLQVPRGERLGLFGPNGSGKTTLLRTLIGELPALGGQVRYGANVSVGYFDQQLKSVDPTLDAMEAIRPAELAKFSDGQLRDILARFGLKGEIVMQQVGSMSGGEKTKVALARLFTHQPNVLILDEPTNHLDLWSCASLEQALKEFEGTLLFVSHDRYFLDQVATNVVVLEPHQWRHFHGNYSEYVAFKKNNLQPQARATAVAPANNKPATATAAKDRRKRKYPYRKAQDLELDIATCEAEIAALQFEMSDAGVLRDHARLKQVMTDLEAHQQRLPQLYEHWEEAMELN